MAQQKHGAFDASALQVAVGCFAEDALEFPDEVSARHVGHGRERGDIQWLGIPAVHPVPGA